MEQRLNAQLPLVPKLRLGMPLRAKLCFARMGVSAGGRAPGSAPQTHPPWEMQFPSSLHYQTEFGNEGGKTGTAQEIGESIARYEMLSSNSELGDATRTQ